jgi:hypothetical protein
MRYDMLVATSVARQGIRGSTDYPLRLSLHSAKNCYLQTEPVHIWLTLANTSLQPITILKTMSFLGGVPGHKVNIRINGHLDRRLITSIDEERRGPRPLASEFVTLFSHESTTTDIPDLRIGEMIQTTGTTPTVGQYTLEVEYRNGFQGPVMEVVPGSSVLEVLAQDWGAWTGTLRSNTVAIHISDDPERCAASNPTDAQIEEKSP